MNLSDLFKDVTHSVNERIRNPYWFSFIIIFIFWNWEACLYLLNMGDFEGLEAKKKEIEKLDFKVLWPVLLAFVGVIAFYLIQYVGLVISVFFQDRLKPNILKMISSKRVATAERLEDLRKFNRQLQAEKASLDDELGKARSEKNDIIKEGESLLDDNASKMADMTYSIKKLEEQLKEKKEEVNILETRYNSQRELRRTSIDIIQVIDRLNTLTTEAIKTAIRPSKSIIESGSLLKEVRIIFFQEVLDKGLRGDISIDEISNSLYLIIQKSNELSTVKSIEKTDLAQRLLKIFTKLIVESNIEKKAGT